MREERNGKGVSKRQGAGKEGEKVGRWVREERKGMGVYIRGA